MARSSSPLRPKGASGPTFRVVVRVRPMLSDDEAELADLGLEGVVPGGLGVVASPGGHSASLIRPFAGSRRFSFDASLGPDATQERVSEIAQVSTLAAAVALGRSATLLAYGPTGTGKSYSMFGDPLDWERGAVLSSEKRGIVPRALEALFGALERIGDGKKWGVRASLVEVYLGRVTDLLREVAAEEKDLEREVEGRRRVMGESEVGRLRREEKERRRKGAFRRGKLADVGLRVRGGEVEGVSYVQGSSARELCEALGKGVGKRTSRATACNLHSSRSHAILSIEVKLSSSSTTSSFSRLVCVDLAGSERLRKSGVEDARETKSINASIATLGNCIHALSHHKPHVPFRDSTLTRLLQPTLTRGSLVTLLACLSPSPAAAEETLNTLLFASRAKRIKISSTHKPPTPSSSQPFTLRNPEEHKERLVKKKRWMEQKKKRGLRKAVARVKRVVKVEEEAEEEEEEEEEEEVGEEEVVVEKEERMVAPTRIVAAWDLLAESGGGGGGEERYVDRENLHPLPHPPLPKREAPPKPLTPQTPVPSFPPPPSRKTHLFASPRALRAPSPLKARRNARLVEEATQLAAMLHGTKTSHKVLKIASEMQLN